MDPTTTKDVRNLPAVKRETEVKSRKLRGFHVFRMHFIEDFLKLSLDAQMDLLRSLLGVIENIGIVSDDDSTDTTGPTGRDICHLVSRWWSDRLCSEIKTAWDDRAKSLNARPVPGKFYRLSRGIHIQLEDLVKVNMKVEWQTMRRLLRTCLLKEAKDPSVAMTMTQGKTAVFGREKVLLGDLSLRMMTMSPLIRCALFGMGDENLLQREIVYKSKEVTVVHLASLARVNFFFTIAGASGMETPVGNGRSNVACGRVALVRCGRHLTGFVVGEARNQLQVRVELGEIIDIARPKNIEELNPSSGRIQGSYQMRQHCGSKLKVVGYWPVRVSLTRKGRVRFLFSCLVTN